MNSVEAETVFLDIVDVFDSLGLDFMTVIEIKDGQSYVSGCIVNGKPLLNQMCKKQIYSIAEKYGLTLREDANSMLIYKPKRNR
jgi:hypothetical protein